jgi:hypothetical protein
VGCFLGRRLERVGYQQRLIRVETLGTRSVESPQEEVEAVLQLLILVPLVAESGEQFEDHLLKGGEIVGQRRRGIDMEVRRGGTGILAHAL